MVWGEPTGYEAIVCPLLFPTPPSRRGAPGDHMGSGGTGGAGSLLTPDFLMVAAGFFWGGPGFPKLLGRSGGRLGKGERRERWGCGRAWSGSRRGVLASRVGVSLLGRLGRGSCSVGTLGPGNVCKERGALLASWVISGPASWRGRGDGRAVFRFRDGTVPKV